MMGLLRFEEAEVNTEKIQLYGKALSHLTAMFITPDGCTLVT